MAVDPWIARGTQPVDISNSLVEIARMREAQARTNELQRRTTLEEQRYNNALSQQDEDDAEWEQAYAAKDWGRMARIDPQTTKILFDREQASKPPAPLEVQSLPGYGTVVTQGGEFKASRATPAPPQYAPVNSQLITRPVGNGMVQDFAWNPRTNQRVPAGEPYKPMPKEGEPAEVTTNANKVPGFSGMPAGVKMTEVQGKNYLGASMLAEHVPVLASLLAEGYVPSKQDLYAIGPPLKGVGNSIMQEITPRTYANPKANQYFTAGSKILTAILRPESGGAITEDEWTMYGPIYLPWPGDSEADRTRKMTSLNAYMKRLAQVSGPASQYFNADEEIIDLPTPR